VYPNGFNARQFVTMTKWGMTPMQAIPSCNGQCRRALGRPGESAHRRWPYGDSSPLRGPDCDIALLQS